MKLITTVSEAVRRLVTRPTSELGRVQRSARYLIELVRHCAGELAHDRASEMAAALTYRTIFSLVPMFVMALIVFNAFGGFKNIGGEVQGKLYSYLGISSLAVPGAAEAGHPAVIDPADASSSENAELRSKVDQIMTDLVDKVSNISFKGIGAVGMGLLIWAALSLMVTIEQSFNRIYGTPTGRPWHLRIAIYWAVITLGPVLLFVSLYLTNQAVAMFSSVGVLSGIMRQVTRFTAFAASWMLLFLLYVLMPNTKVNWRSAAAGAFVTAILYETGKWGFQLYVDKAVPYAKLYGSLGLVPLFLFWVYLTWLIVLFGLELTYTLQAMKGHRFKHLAEDRTGEIVADPQWMIPLLAHVAVAFDEGRAMTRGQLAQALGLPERAVAELTRQLESQGLIHRVQGASPEDTGITLAQPPERIAVARLLQLINDITLTPTKRTGKTGWEYLEELQQAQRHAAGNASLATLVRKHA